MSELAKKMSTKTVKRILFGVVGVGYLIFAGQEMLQAGLSMDAALPGGIGVTFSYLAYTGAG